MSPSVLCVGGVDLQLRLSFLKCLAELDFEVAAAGSGPAEPFCDSGIRFHSYRFSRFGDPLGDIRALRELRELMRRTKPDIVQSFDTKPNILAPIAARGLRTKVVRTINGMGWAYSTRSRIGKAVRPLYRALQRAASLSTAAVVFQNSDDLAYFERHCLNGRSKVRLIAGSGVDVGRFKEAQANGAQREATRAALGLEGSEVVMTVSRLTTQKGIPNLLKAAELVSRVRPRARFVLVGPREGEGPFAVPAEELERHSRYVLAIGPRTDVPSLLGAADVFAFPSEYREGVPRVLLEAGLAGLPIVTTEMPGCTDVVCDGWNGYLVPPGSAETLAERIIALLDEPERAKEMGRRSVGFVSEAFALDTVLDQYVALYQEVLEGSLAPIRPASCSASDPDRPQVLKRRDAPDRS